MYKDILNIIFPSTCKVCDGYLMSKKRGICHQCYSQIEFLKHDHPFMHQWFIRLYSRFPIVDYYTLFDISFNDFAHEIIKAIKYNDAPEIAFVLGKQLGKQIPKNQLKEISGLIPVPMHPEKFRKRGYNQAWHIAKGISEISGIEIFNENVIRTVNSDSQTQKNRWERLQNVDHVFSLINDQLPDHLLLVDDVLTTGSTLENLAKALPVNIKKSIATLAVA